MCNEDINRLREIQEEILDLLHEAKGIISDYPGASSRAEAYWLAHAKMAITNEHGYLGGSMVTMEDTINEIEEGQ